MLKIDEGVKINCTATSTRVIAFDNFYSVIVALLLSNRIKMLIDAFAFNSIQYGRSDYVHSLHSHLHRLAEGAIASDDRTALEEDALMRSLAIPQPGVPPAAIT